MAANRTHLNTIANNVYADDTQIYITVRPRQEFDLTLDISFSICTCSPMEPSDS